MERVFTAERKPREPCEETEEQPGVHPCQERIVPQVAELRNATFLAAEVADRRGEIEDRDAAPSEADGDLVVEVEAAG
jgi:hypothetical protein